MYDVNYGEFEDLKKQLINKRIAEWTEDKLVLEDGTVVTIECSESDCCASAGGTFKDVKLDALITDISKTASASDYDDGWGETTNETTITIFHNQNPIAVADCYANDGNGGYYYSVGSLVVKDIHYPVVEA